LRPASRDVDSGVEIEGSVEGWCFVAVAREMFVCEGAVSGKQNKYTIQ
jgi:hypothetical protein